jgi:hypothetical protein
VDIAYNMPHYGALGATFQLARLFQAVSLIAIIGMTAKFIASIVSNNATPPNILIGTISVVSLIQFLFPAYN